MFGFEQLMLSLIVNLLINNVLIIWHSLWNAVGNKFLDEKKLSICNHICLLFS